MKKTLQDQYLLIKEGKGHTGVFLTEAKRQFPNIVRNAATFEEAAASLITKNIITENIVSLGPINSPFDSKKKESYELAFENFLAEAKEKKENEDEKVKAEEKKVSKRVEEDYSHNFDNSDEKNPDNMIFDQIMMGYYAEMKDPKNADKTMQELKDMVFKNLTKDPIFYTKDGQFGVKGLGYTTEAPGLGTPKEAKGKYKASGYGDLKEGKYRTYLDDQHMGGLDVWQNEDGTWPEVDYKWNLTGEYEDGAYEGDSVEESKLRKVIREMVDGEIEEMRHLGNMFQSKLGDDKKERAERDPSQFKTTYIEPSVVKSLIRDQHLKILPSRSNPGTFALAIRAILEPSSDKNIKGATGTAQRTDFLDTLTVDIPPELKSFLVDKNNLGGEYKFSTKQGDIATYKVLNNATLNKQGSLVFKVPNPNYVKEGVIGVIDNDVAPSYPINVPISYSDDKNVAHYSDDYEYDRQEGLLDVEDYLKQIEGMSKGDAFNYLEEMGLGNDEILTILKNHRSLSLRESIDKELMAINKEAEHEIIASKLEKVQALIDKKQSQISRLDEDEDMKDLTDAKKVKEISKDIKSLEKAKAKLEKIMHKGKSKTPRKEVIDEIEDEDGIEDETYASEGYLAAKEDAEQRYDEGEEIDSIISNYQNLSFDDRNMLRQDLEGKMDGMDY
jgi:hypothetical protein